MCYSFDYLFVYCVTHKMFFVLCSVFLFDLVGFNLLSLVLL